MAVSGIPVARTYVTEEEWGRATLADRLGAWLIDLVVLVVACYLVASVLGLTASRQGSWVADDGTTTTATATYIPAQWFGLLLALLSALYAIPLWLRNRATLGQRLRHLRVVDVEGTATLTLRRGAVRWLALYGWAFAAMGSAIGVPALSAGFTILFLVWIAVLIVTTRRDIDKRGLHDRLARSRVEKCQVYKVVAPRPTTASGVSAPSVPKTRGASRGPRRSTRRRPAKG